VRTITAAERATVAALHVGHYSKFEVQDADGVYRDYTQYLNTDWFTGATISESQDQSTMTLNATLLKQTGTLSLSPFRSDSLVNRNAGGSYANAIDAWRKWKLSVAVMREGYPPTGSDWKELCQGRIDVIEWSGDQIIITGRGEEAVLLDFWIAAERQYGSVGGIAMETTLQSQMDDNIGAAVYSLFTPVSPGYLMQPWTQPKDRLFSSMVAVSDKVGDVLRMRYDASNVQRLTLFAPNRTASPGSEVWTLGPAEYTAIRKIAIDKQGIRNFIKIRFAHPTLGTQTVIYPHQAGVGTVSCAAGVATFSNSQAAFIKTTGSKTEIIVGGIAYTINTFNGTTGATLIPQLATGGLPTFSATAFTLHDTVSLSGTGSTASLDRFSRNDLEIDLAFTTQVTDPTKAQAMADAIGSDTEFPPVEQEIETSGFWFVQLHDYGRFLANGVDSDVDLYAAVTSIRHEIANGTIKTTIGVRGKPSSKYAGWRFIKGAQSTGGNVPQLIFAECLTQITATSATQVTVTVTANPASPPQQVQLVGITGSATLASGTAAGTWVTPNGTNNVWVFNRGAINAGVGQVQFRAGNTSSFPNDDKFVTIEEQGRDTVFLAMRARVTATTPTTVTVRVAVADPYPQGAGSATISYQDLGSGGVSPASGGTVTPAATLTEAAGTFIDYTVTRPAFGAGAGRVTFTATAANRTTDSDAVDIPEVDRDTLGVQVRVLRVSETTDQVVIRIEAITPIAGQTVTVNYNAGGLTVSPATGGTFSATTAFGTTNHIDYTITRDTQGGTPRRVAFTASATGYVDGTDGVDVTPNSLRNRCNLVLSSTPTQATGTTPTVVTLWSESASGGSDVGNLHDDSVNPGRIVIPANGGGRPWLFTASIGFQFNATGDRYVEIRKNGTAVRISNLPSTKTSSNSTVMPIYFFDPNPSVSDYYEVAIWQNSGITLNISSGTTESNFAACDLFSN
jgi:hypothetical protein